MTESEIIYIHFKPFFYLLFVVKSSTLKHEIHFEKGNRACLQNCCRNCETLGSCAPRILVLSQHGLTLNLEGVREVKTQIRMHYGMTTFRKLHKYLKIFFNRRTLHILKHTPVRLQRDDSTFRQRGSGN